MGNTKEIQQYIQRSLEEALQGLAFWISYRQVLCHEHPINEGALVAEFVTLLRAKLDSDFVIFNETKYDENSRERIDIEIAKRDSNARIAIIEVKRVLASKALIDKDIKKLIEAKKKENKDVTCYLAVISENKIPKLFVNKNGHAVRNLSFEKDFTASIRILKSIKAFKGKNGKIPQANYCCLLKISPSTR